MFHLSELNQFQLKMIPQKLKSYRLNFLQMLSIKHCFEKITNRIGYRARLRGAMGQSYSIYACTCASNWSALFTGPRYILR